MPASYQPVGARQGGPSPGDLRRAAEWRRAALIEPSPGNLRQLGIAHATVASLDDAIRILEELSATGDGGALALSDLSAAYIARSRNGDDVADLFFGLNAAGASLHLDQNFAPAWFNAAIVQAQLGLRTDALHSWQRFLDTETDTAWRAEAQSRADQLRAIAPPTWAPGEKVEPATVFIARRWLLAQGIPDFARGGSTTMTVLADVAHQLSSMTNDPSWKEAVSELSGSASIRQAYLLYADAQHASRVDDFPRRRSSLVDACRRFRAAASPLTALCLAEQAGVEMLSLDYPAATLEATTAGRLAAGRGYRFAAARAIAAEAMVDTSIGKFDRAAELFPSAIKGLLETHAFPEAVGVETTFADVLNLIGRQREGWHRRRDALRAALRLSDPDSEYSVFSSAAVFSSNAGLLHAARQFAAVPHGELSAMRQVAKLQRQVRAESAVGNYAAAHERLAEIRKRLAASTDPRARTIEADIDVGAGLLLAAEGHAGDAIEMLNTGISRMGIVRQRQRTDALVWVSRLETRAGRLNEARSHLEDATARVRARLKPATVVGSLVDERAWLWNAASDLVLAADGAGGERDIALLEGIKNAWSAAARPSDLPGSQSHTRLLYFVVGENAIGAWCQRNGALTFRRLEASPSELGHILSRLRLQYRSGLSAETLNTLQMLRKLVLGPFERDLEGAASVHIVPDGLLFGVPFAGLRSASGRFLIEDAELSFSYTLSDSTAPAKATGPVRALLVGNPTTGEAEPLPDARREVDDIARAYETTSTVILTDAAATEATFRQEIATASIVHFAGHAVADPAAPERSRLLLARSNSTPDQDGALSVAELRSGLALTQGPLVVLAACRTAGAQTDRRFGVGHLASELLRAGATGVIATVDDIPDQTTALYVALHRRLARGLPPAAALRQAQVELLSSKTISLESWALALFYGNPHPEAD